MTNVTKANWVRVYSNSDFICVKTVSGYRSGTHIDPKGKEFLLPTTVSDYELGCSVLEALESSRFVLPAPQVGSVYSTEIEFDLTLYDHKLVSDRYIEWVKRIMMEYGYKTKPAMFKKMKNCSISKNGENITIQPSHHEKLELWSGAGINVEDRVIIASNSTPEIVGAGLRIAFERCTD